MILGEIIGRSLYVKIRDVLRLFGVNKAVAYGVLSKIWFACAGIITFVLIAVFLSPEEQGYYFSFYSLLALQVFVELGLLNVIINFASHEWSKLRIDRFGNITGNQKALSRLGSLAKAAFLWFTVGGILILFGLGICGYFFFSNAKQFSVDWMSPWFFLCLFTGINLCILPAFALLEGCNQVAQVYYFRLIQEIARFLSSWVMIVIGLGLWAPAVSTLAIIIWSLIYLVTKYFNYFKSLLSPISGLMINWWDEVWPMQWRIAISFLCGYFSYSLFTPFIFYFHGAKLAGQMGMTWSAANTLLVLSSMWVITRVPHFGALIAKKKYGQLDRQIFRSTLVALVIAIFGAFSIFILIYLFNSLHSPYASRFLSPMQTAILLVATVLQVITSSEGYYLRAHKIEPYMWVSIITAILMIISIATTGIRWGVTGVALSYLGVTALYVLPHATWIWLRCRQQWHGAKKIDLKSLGRFLSSEIDQGFRAID